MGYYTDFSLDIQPESALTKETLNKLGEAFDSGYLSIIDLLDGNCEPMKWYSHTSDMTKLSNQFPTFLFILDGEGEEAGDVWREFFWQGNSEQVKQPEWERPERPKGWTAKDEESLHADAEGQVLADQVEAQKNSLSDLAEKLRDHPELKAELRKALDA